MAMMYANMLFGFYSFVIVKKKYVYAELTYHWITSPSAMGVGLSVLSHSPLKAFTSQSLNSADVVSI